MINRTPTIAASMDLNNTATLARRGNMEVKLASNAAEIKASQALRYRVFYQEMSAVADGKTQKSRIDKDDFDDFCEHLIVVDHSRRNFEVGGTGRGPAVIGTYRMLTQDAAEKKGGFYSDGEYNFTRLVNRQRHRHRFLELGRSCVLKQYRTGPVLELLWSGIWTYVRQVNLDVMVGCASFEGMDPDALALPLSFLHHKCSAPDEWSVKAVSKRYINMNRMPESDLDVRSALKLMPPLIKGYLRLGAYIGDGAVIDEQFGTTDILIILPSFRIPARYLAHFGGTDKQVAA